MTKLHKITTVILLTAVMLLTGCAECGNTPTPGADTDINTSSDISDNNSPDTTETSSESSESSGNSTSTTSENSSSDTPDSVSEPESSSGTESNSDSSSEESSDTNDYTIPIEFTEEDRELQKILEDLGKGTTALDAWFTNGAPGKKSLVFQFPEINHPNLNPYYQHYGPIPDGYSEAGFVIPNTCDGIREIMLEYFSERCTSSFMSQVGTGRMTENPDGTFTVMLDDKEKEWNPKFLEIDGKMYREDSWGGKGLAGIQAINSASAKIVLKTDDTIEFTYVTAYWYDTDEEGNPKYIDDVSLYEENAHTGVLKYERGGWRRDWDKE